MKQLYRLYGAEDDVAAKAWLEYGHQYNVHAREFMYAWFRQYLQGKVGEVKEPAFKPPVAKRQKLKNGMSLLVVGIPDNGADIVAPSWLLS